MSERGVVGLINNAGIATSGTLIHQPLDEIRNQFSCSRSGKNNYGKARAGIRLPLPAKLSRI